MTPAEMRTDYAKDHLDESDLSPDPIRQFLAWFEEAKSAGVPEPNAMTLATATPEGRPSARLVLLKGIDDRGFTLFTNRESRKGQELDANPFASLVFFWPQLERQVRVEGRVERVSDAESDAYHDSRPESSRIAAWASPQSQVLPDRASLDARLATATAEFAGRPVPRPPHWGGYRVVPESVEFWQGRPSRLHDRLVYRKSAGDAWTIERIAP